MKILESFSNSKNSVTSKISIEMLNENTFFTELEEKLKEKEYKEIFLKNSIINWEIYNLLGLDDFMDMGFDKGCSLIFTKIIKN
jgi:hypothetical protein